MSCATVIRICANRRPVADLVTAWPTYNVDTKQGLVQIRNASDGAVYRIALIFEQERGGGAT